MPETLHVAIVDDHPLFREGVVHTLGRAARHRDRRRGGIADDAIRMAAERVPDVMLLDMSMPGGGLSAVQGDRGRLPCDQAGDADGLRGRGRRDRGPSRGRPGLRAERRCRPRARPHHARGSCPERSMSRHASRPASCSN